MATLFGDLEAGNNANDGSSFANRFQNFTNGATAARTAPGDTIRWMACKDPTSLGNALWTKRLNDASMAATLNISSASNATPIVVTTTTAHGLATGDVVQIRGQTGTRYINGLWEIIVLTTTTFSLNGSVASGVGTNSGTVRLYTSRVIKLATACNKSIDMCEVAWTAAANVTASINSTCKQGDQSMSIAVAAGFTTGKCAYRALPATIDLSAYEQVTLWVRTNTSFGTGVFSLRLCSDATGDVTVDNLAIPAITGVNAWVPITIDKAAALGAAIASIAIYADSDPGTVTLLIDNIAAVKNDTAADSLGLQSLISKNSGSYSSSETWYPIGSIEETVVALDCGQQWTNGSGPQRHMGWWGTTETVTTYKLEPISLAMVASGDIGLTVNESGSSGNLITHSGGWNRTDMTTQTGMTWIDCRNGLSSGITWTSRSFIRLERFGVVRANRGFEDSNFSDSEVADCHANGNNNQGFQFGSGQRNTLSNIFACNNAIQGVALGRVNNDFHDHVLGDCFKKINCNGGQQTASSNSGLTIAGARISIGIISELCGNYHSALQFIQASQVTIEEIANLSDNANGGIIVNGGYATIHKITSCDRNGSVFRMNGQGADLRVHQLTSSNHPNAINNSDNIVGGSVVRVRRWVSTDTVINGMNSDGDCRVMVDRWGDTVDDHRWFVPGCDGQSEATVRHTASGISWRFAPTSTILITSAWPAILPLARPACEANKLVTIKAWVRRSHTDLTIGICAKKSQLTGMAADATASISVAADTWEELTITFTPTESGVVEIVAFAHGGTAHFGYIDDMTISQAS